MYPEMISSHCTITSCTLIDIVRTIMIFEVITYSKKYVLSQNVYAVIPVQYKHSWFLAAKADKIWFELLSSDLVDILDVNRFYNEPVTLLKSISYTVQSRYIRRLESMKIKCLRFHIFVTKRLNFIKIIVPLIKTLSPRISGASR